MPWGGIEISLLLKKLYAKNGKSRTVRTLEKKTEQTNRK